MKKKEEQRYERQYKATKPPENMNSEGSKNEPEKSGKNKEGSDEGKKNMQDTVHAVFSILPF
ncbi:hypothetical protein VU04_12580, partial [Desulfobulbus sp. TB]|nr:hypothetical protein [Desulfobulbus sp. TB]